jgi:ribosomal protein S21
MTEGGSKERLGVAGKDALRLTRTTISRKEPALKVFVRDNNIDQALRVLKKKMQREGLFREMKRRGAYENAAIELP